MSVKAYGAYGTKVTPQSEPIPGETQVQNSAGGYVYSLDKWTAFERFLILGTEGGTYYVSERPLTAQAAANTIACIAEDAGRAVQMIVSISDSGRAPKNDPAIFALALVASAKDVAARKLAYVALPLVCRIPTHLFHFLAFCKQNRGWSRGLRKAVQDWYARWTPERLAYEVVKYQSRDGWANKDAFRLSHYGANTAVMRWVVGASRDAREVTHLRTKATLSYGAVGELPAVIAAFEEAKALADTADLLSDSRKRIVKLIREHNLSREMVPTAALKSPEVWEALLDKMPPHAMLRNLGNMSKVGLLTSMSEAAKLVVSKLENANVAYLREKRVHPVAVLLALRVYAAGRSVKGDGTWTPVQPVVDALDSMFYRAFGAVEPTGKRIMLALDVSGSMGAPISGLPLSCREAAAAMAMVTARVEPNHMIVGFTNGGAVSGRSKWPTHLAGISPLKISPRQRLDDVVRYTAGLNFGGTDCALPALYATKANLDIDAFVIVTDNETWAGSVHPSQALNQYRATSDIQAKQVVVAMTPTEFTIADPTDSLSLDVVGFDANTPQAISEFIR